MQDIQKIFALFKPSFKTVAEFKSTSLTQERGLFYQKLTVLQMLINTESANNHALHKETIPVKKFLNFIRGQNNHSALKRYALMTYTPNSINNEALWQYLLSEARYACSVTPRIKKGERVPTVIRRQNDMYRALHLCIFKASANVLASFYPKIQAHDAMESYAPSDAYITEAEMMIDKILESYTPVQVDRVSA